jgi:hypothetical protein
MLEAEQVPDQKALVAFIRKGVTSLAVKALVVTDSLLCCFDYDFSQVITPYEN